MSKLYILAITFGLIFFHTSNVGLIKSQVDERGKTSSMSDKSTNNEELNFESNFYEDLNAQPLLGKDGPFGSEPSDLSKLQPTDMKDYLGGLVRDGKLHPGKAFVYASYFGHIELVKELLSKGVNINTSINGNTSLMMAIANYNVEIANDNNIEIVKYLLSQGADVNRKSSDGSTALMNASYWGNVEIVQLLVNSGANVNERDSEGMTALMVAARRDIVDVVTCLLKNGSDVNTRDNNNATALIHLIAGWYDYEIGKINTRTVKALLKAGIDKSIKDKTGRNAFMYAKNYKQNHILYLLK
jgi:ankyrin repeat protein